MIDSLGDRMKAYETAGSITLMRRTPVVVRVDGRAFHTWTKRVGYKRPLDPEFNLRMIGTANFLSEELDNVVFTYTQSDEISIVMVDDRTLETEAMFGNRLQKIVSIAAAAATVRFSELGAAGHLTVSGAMFDARAFNLPFAEVNNYLIWRQRDAERNCVNAYGQEFLGHSRIQGLNRIEVSELLKNEHGIYVNELSNWQIRGTAIPSMLDACTGRIVRRVDYHTPKFSENPKYVENCLEHTPVYVEPVL